MKFAVIRTGGKQYVVTKDQEIVVDVLSSPPEEKINLETLLISDEGKLEIGKPLIKTGVTAQIVAHMKGDKTRVTRFKSKVRYRRSIGFRPHLTKIKIITL